MYVDISSFCSRRKSQTTEKTFFGLRMWKSFEWSSHAVERMRTTLKVSKIRWTRKFPVHHWGPFPSLHGRFSWWDFSELIKCDIRPQFLFVDISSPAPSPCLHKNFLLGNFWALTWSISQLSSISHLSNLKWMNSARNHECLVNNYLRNFISKLGRTKWLVELTRVPKAKRKTNEIFRA